MCIREARWIGKHPNSLKLQKVLIEEFEQSLDYGLKDITKLDDFNQVVDWQNSSFYQSTNQSSQEEVQMALIVIVELLHTEVLRK